MGPGDEANLTPAHGKHELQLSTTILTDKDVQHEWSVAVGDEVHGDPAADLLLKSLVKLFTTIRGHAFTSSCTELYKQSKKTLQKKRGL